MNKRAFSLQIFVGLFLLLTCSTALTGCFKEWDLDEVKGWYQKQPESWEDFIQAANTAVMAGKPDKAAEYFNHATDMAEQTWGPTDMRVATSAKEHAIMEASRYKFADAEPLFKKAFQIQVKGLKPSDPDLLDTRKRYHDVLIQLFKADEAKEVLGNAKDSAPAKRKQKRSRHH